MQIRRLPSRSVHATSNTVYGMHADIQSCTPQAEVPMVMPKPSKRVVPSGAVVAAMAKSRHGFPEVLKSANNGVVGFGIDGNRPIKKCESMDLNKRASA